MQDTKSFQIRILVTTPLGPTLLQDHHLTEKLAHFDRERILERVVHPRGVMAAKGYFEATKTLQT